MRIEKIKYAGLLTRLVPIVFGKNRLKLDFLELESSDMERLTKKNPALKTFPRQNENFFPKRNSLPHGIQPKLTINQGSDLYEKQADAMADKVMRMPDHDTQQQSFFKPNSFPIQRKCEKCEEEENNIQRKGTNDSPSHQGSEIEAYVNQLDSKGKELSPETLNFFEPRFGYDFSHVRVHTDSIAAKSARSINALAYTSGNNIVFNSSQYSPESAKGKKLLGHELTHVVQQNSSPTKNMISRQEGGCTNTKQVVVDLISFLGSNRNPYDDLAEANRIFQPCCVEFVPGQGRSVDPNFSNPLMGNDTTFERETCGSNSSEEEDLIPAITSAFSLNGRLRAFYFERINPSARATSHPQYCSSALTLNHVYMTNTASTRTLAHEFGHILLNGYFHELPADNLMRPTNTATGSNLTPEQCATIFENA